MIWLIASEKSVNRTQINCFYLNSLFLYLWILKICLFVVLHVQHLFFELTMFNIKLFPLSSAFHSQLTAPNENNENIEPSLTTPLADAESRPLPQAVENCNSKRNFNHLVNKIGPDFIWKPKWELFPVDGSSGVQPSKLLNSTAVMTPHSNKSFEELFLNKVKPPATKD